jgi:nitroimidazol reductase NimA-like FMN-containing flavoprotein (pyridoxamine 5'-phosphate oxidase superfamily)
VAEHLHEREEWIVTEPTTELDVRFSGPGAAVTSWQETRDAIENAQLFWISTVRADGRPHVTPLVAVWLDDALHFCTGRGEQKAVNVRANPHVVLTTGRNEWKEGVDVVVEGEARQVTDDATLTRLAEAWAGKWDGRWHYRAGNGAFWEGEREVAMVFAVKPAKILAFTKDPFGHTRHLF